MAITLSRVSAENIIGTPQQVVFQMTVAASSSGQTRRQRNFRALYENDVIAPLKAKCLPWSIRAQKRINRAFALSTLSDGRKYLLGYHGGCNRQRHVACFQPSMIPPGQHHRQHRFTCHWMDPLPSPTDLQHLCQLRRYNAARGFRAKRAQPITTRVIISIPACITTFDGWQLFTLQITLN